MKFSVNWLKQWVRLDLDVAALAEKLTAAGLEVEAMEPVAAAFEGVVVAEIESCAPHPEADKLSVCTVNDGGAERLQIVCGATNARAGMRAPLARIGAAIGPDLRIRKARLRGVESEGMLCSARELGLSDDHSGLMELPADAPLGEDFRHWLSLDDFSLEINLTPNRADCLSIRGLARDVAATCNAEYTGREIPAVPAEHDLSLPVTLDSAPDCPRYAGRIIDGIDSSARTPLWMREALRRSGLRSISPVVDVTNYVLLETGQPMHAFDLDRLEGGITVRRGRPGESLQLLDTTEVQLDPDVLVICDGKGPVALAGIMGGLKTAVSGDTTRVFLESAWFRPAVIMGKARSYGMHTDASHRFERGVDPGGQVEAIERATSLLISICGGRPGPVQVAEQPELVPGNPSVRLRLDRLNRLAGLTFDRPTIDGILSRLGMAASFEHGAWTVTAPSARMDISIEEDLIEEVVRVHGYDHIPEAEPNGIVAAGNAASHLVPLGHFQQSLCAAGYQEVINYSFVDRQQLVALRQEHHALPLANPLSADLGVMRTTLMPGLLASLTHNLYRQHDRVRLFETGRAYVQTGSLSEIPRIAGVATGTALPEKWSEPARPLDFFDVKGDVERLLALSGTFDAEFAPADAAWLHPGASATVRLQGREIGWCGALHPRVLRELDVPGDVFAFELDLAPMRERKVPSARPVSRFPSIRRDLAVWVPEAVTYGEIRSIVTATAGELLQNLVVFDVYQDEKLKKAYKSVAIGLILQNVSSTLTDEIVDPLLQKVIEGLTGRLGATLRG